MFTARFEELTQMAEAGDAGAQCALGAALATGEHFASGRAVPQDLEAAARWYRKAADQGHIEAAYNLATMHLEEEIAGASRDEGMALLHRCADAGFWDAHWLLAPIFAKGLYGQAKDAQRAADHSVAALEITYANAAEALADHLREGDAFDVPALATAFDRVAQRLRQRHAAESSSAQAAFEAGSPILLPPPQIETARLLLRRPQLADAEAIFAGYAADATVTRYLTWRPHESDDATRGFLRLCQDQWGDGENRPYVIAARTEPSRALGMIDWRRDGEHAVTFGYVLAPACWGRAYTVEALTALVDWSLAQPAIFRAWAFCDVDNRASARVMEKAGMTFEGILRRFYLHPNVAAEPRDCRVYAKVRA
jgi:RimJ/RimL family protein N-acetyltransferase